MSGEKGPREFLGPAESQSADWTVDSQDEPARGAESETAHDQRPINSTAGTATLPIVRMTRTNIHGQVEHSELVKLEEDETAPEKPEMGTLEREKDVSTPEVRIKGSGTEDDSTHQSAMTEEVKGKPALSSHTKDPQLVTKSGSKEVVDMSASGEDKKTECCESSATPADYDKKDPSITEYTSNLQTASFNTKKFQENNKIFKFPKRLQVDNLTNIEAEILPHNSSTDGSCWTQVRITAKAKKKLLKQMQDLKQFSTVRLTTQVLHSENTCKPHQPVQMRDDGKISFMCKLLDTNKELNQWKERMFSISLEVILQVHSTCHLKVQEVEDDYLSITAEDV